MSEGASKTALSKEQARRLIAIEEMDIAEEFEGAAAAARTPAARRRDGWRQAREWYRQSLEKWRELQDQGALSAADAGRPEEVSREIAKCEVALRE